MTRGRTLYLDLVGGVAGDMLLAALLDAGAPVERVRAAVAALGLRGVELVEREVSPAGLRAKQLDVLIEGVLADTEKPASAARRAEIAVRGAAGGESRSDESHAAAVKPASAARRAETAVRGAAGGESRSDESHAAAVQVPGGQGHLVLEGHAAPDAHHGHHHGHGHRAYAEIRALIDGADLAPAVKARAQDAFRRLAEAEALAHGLDPERVVFHEVGADDAIVDIVGVAVAVEALGVDRIEVSPPPLGRGLTRGGHGPIPLPGPAVLHLLQGLPTASTELVGETVTPTGAALVASLADAFGPAPSMVLERVGVGAGHKVWPDRPNIVRALLGRSVARVLERVDEDCVVETNLDDLSPELLADLEGALFAAGALDVWMTPIHMKKGRPGIQVSALCRTTLQSVIAEAFMNHSTTLGVRLRPVARLRAPRTLEVVPTEFGEVRVKRSPRTLGGELVAPEHEDCAARAAEAGVPVRAVYEAALKAAWAGDA